MRRLLKAIADGSALLLVLPGLLIYRLIGPILGPERAFQGWSQMASLFPGLSGVYLRRAFYCRVFPHCAKDCWIGFGTIFSHPSAAIGRSVYVGPFCCLGAVVLEDDVLLGSHVSVMNGGRQHGIERLDIPIREQPGDWPQVTIGQDSWIGDRSTILANVGRHCVIGAGSVVTRPIPDYAVAVGVPAKILRFRKAPESGSRPALPAAH